MYMYILFWKHAGTVFCASYVNFGLCKLKLF